MSQRDRAPSADGDRVRADKTVADASANSAYGQRSIFLRMPSIGNGYLAVVMLVTAECFGIPMR